MKDLIYPYRTFSGDVILQMEAVAVAAAERWVPVPAASIDPTTGTVDLTGSETAASSTVRIELNAAAPPNEIAELEPDYQALHATVIAHCGRTNSRIASRLERSQTDRSMWSGSLEVPGLICLGGLQIVCRISGVGADGLPRLVGESEAWTVYLDEPELPPLRGELPVSWKQFSVDPEQPMLHEFPDEPFYVDLAGARPQVFLNSGIRSLRTVLPTDGPPKGRSLRPLYEMTRTSFARSTWIALFQAAVAGIRTVGTDEDAEDGDVDWPELAWQKDVLKKMLARLYPGTGYDEALREIAAARRSPDAFAEITSQAVGVIERDIVRDGRAVRRALSAIDKYEGDD